MTKKLKFGLILALSFVLVSLASNAFATALDWDADTTISLSSPAINLIIKSGSGATDLVVNTGDIIATVPNGSTFRVTSASRNLTVTNAGNASLAQSCDSANTAIVNLTGGSDENAITITPTSAACVYVGGDGGAPAGGGGGGDTTPPANTSVVINANAAKTATASVTLTLAATDATEMMVSESSNFADGVWVTYTTSKAFTLSTGEGTKTVYAKFRDAVGNASTAVSDTIVYSLTATAAETVTPVVTVPVVTAPTAPVTIPTLSAKPTVNEMSAVLSAITSQVLYIQANLTSPNVLTLLQDVLVRVAGLQSAISGTPATTFSQSLYNGIQNSDVTALQNFLTSQGTEIYPEGLVTGYFGSLTEKAVQRFQVKYGLAQPGDPGYGYVGPKTRAKINQLLGL